ncbi:DUF1501 domain-containing protein [soil metagenome]
MGSRRQTSHPHPHAFNNFHAREAEGLVVASRRNFLKAGWAGLAGLSLPTLLQAREEGARTGQPLGSGKSVILLWMAGGPSHIDTWDPKPDRPIDNRGPFGVIPTRLPGVHFCEHLPKQAAMLDQFTVIRSVDAQFSNHEPNSVFQTGNTEAAPRVNVRGHLYPSIGSIVAKLHGPNHPAMPANAAFIRSRTHIPGAGYLGKKYDPFPANSAATLPLYNDVGVPNGRMSKADLFRFPKQVSHERILERRSLAAAFDQMRKELDVTGNMDAMDRYSQQAVEMLVGGRARAAFDLSRESPRIRDRYGSHLWCQQALLARRLVEAGVAFVTIDLSYHPSSGTWDTHGDNIPPYGGIRKGLQPLLPLFDHLFTTLLQDLRERGLLNDVLLIAMGEFGRTPRIGTQESTDGRDHWPSVMSMALAGGGMRHGQVIGASEQDGGQIKHRPVTPGDLAATIYKHMGVPLDATYLDNTGRPRAIVEKGQPIAELI